MQDPDEALKESRWFGVICIAFVAAVGFVNITCNNGGAEAPRPRAEQQLQTLDQWWKKHVDSRRTIDQYSQRELERVADRIERGLIPPPPEPVR